MPDHLAKMMTALYGGRRHQYLNNYHYLAGLSYGKAGKRFFEPVINHGGPFHFWTTAPDWRGLCRRSCLGVDVSSLW